jgi:hypothetical protein
MRSAATGGCSSFDDGDQSLRELRRVAALLAAHRFAGGARLGGALGVVVDRQRSPSGRSELDDETSERLALWFAERLVDDKPVEQPEKGENG